MGLLQHNNFQIDVIENMVPICAWCQRIRDRHRNWHVIDLEQIHNSGYELTHAICIECAKSELASIHFIDEAI